MSFTGETLLIAPNFGVYLQHELKQDYNTYYGRWGVAPYQCRIDSGRNKHELGLTTFFDGALYSCGGGECISMALEEDAKWKKVKFPKGALSQSFFRGAVVYNKKIWVLNNNEDELTSDFLDPVAKTVEPGPSYPVGRNGGCNIQINDTTVLVTGGHPTDPATLFLNLETKEWTVGPDLTYNRNMHVCALMVTKQGDTLAIGKMYRRAC